MTMASKAAGRGTDTIYGIVSFAIALALFFHTFSERYEFNHLFGDVSTVLVPRVLLISWMALSLLLVVKDRMSLAVFGGVNWPRLALVSVLSVATTVALWLFGFLAVMPVGLFLLGWAFGYRRWLILAMVSIVGPLAVWLILDKLAAVSLPEARIGGMF